MADEESGEEDCQSMFSQSQPDDEAELELYAGGFSLESGELGEMDCDDLLYWTIMRHFDKFRAESLECVQFNRQTYFTNFNDDQVRLFDGFRAESPEHAEFDPQIDFMNFDDDYIELNDFLYPVSDADISD